MAVLQTKPTCLWQLATINLGSNAAPTTGLLQIFQELADESKEQRVVTAGCHPGELMKSQQPPMMATVDCRMMAMDCCQGELMKSQQLPMLVVTGCRL